MLRSFALARTLLPAGLVIVLSAILLGCSSGAGADDSPTPAGGGISIATVTPAVVQGGKVETPPVRPTSTATTGAAASADAAPTTGRWIDVDVTRYVVKLMNGTQAVQTISPVAVGVNVNTGEYESTQTGLFHVYNKIGGLQYDAPYEAYIADWVAFDPAKDNGFHSYLLDENGAVADASTGRVSNGCIRTNASKTIFEYSEVGMAVYVHL